MAQKNAAPESGKERDPLIIPQFKDYFMEKDPTDPYSREKFDPWRFEFTKTGAGGMKISTREAGVDPEESTNGLEIIFLFESPHVMCQAKNNATNEARFCYSPDRKFAQRGFMCAECPFDKKKHPDPRNEKVSRPMKRTVYFLARKPKKGDPFRLIRYTTGFNTIDGYVALKNSAKTKMKNEYQLEKPIAGAGTVVMFHKLERPKPEDQTVVVGRFDPSRFELGTRLTEEEMKQVIALQTDLIHYNDDYVAKQHEFYEKKYLENKRLSKLDPWAIVAEATKTPEHADGEIPPPAPDDDDSTEFNPEKLEGLTAPDQVPEPTES